MGRINLCSPGLGGRLRNLKGARVGAVQRVLEHVADAVRALDGRDVPRQRDQVAPEARRREQPGRAGGVLGLEGGVEVIQPHVDRLCGRRFARCCRHLGHLDLLPSSRGC